MEYQKLLEFCDTVRQREVIQTIIDNNGDQVAAAKVLGITERGVRKTSKLVRDRASKCGYDLSKGRNYAFSDASQPVSGYSTLVRLPEDDPSGRVLEWVKTSKSAAQQQSEMQIAADAFAAELPRVNPAAFYNHSDDLDLIPWFNIGDAHLGMLAHDKEVGHNFDLKIAERELCEALSLMIERAPHTNRCVVQDMGDFTHYENMAGKTSESGHDLDFDTRFNKMIWVYSRVMKFIVETALAKYENVDVIINQGNHSRVNDHWMAVHLSAVYENEPRLTVLNNGSIFIPYRMGNTFIMSHHSDKCKGVKLAGVMANDFAQDWGETKYHYIDVGHVHHKSVTKEDNGVIIESFNQLAPPDKYAHDGGWRSRQMLTTVLRSKTYGETGRLILTAEEVKDRLLQLKPGTTAQARREVYTV
ncbi:metallo-dependent phosphatase-like protein [Vibrio phage 511E55-1]|nr:metallo-dependent phosphatase-like protein [Vibrio phage 511E55-1]